MIADLHRQRVWIQQVVEGGPGPEIDGDTIGDVRFRVTGPDVIHRERRGNTLNMSVEAFGDTLLGV